MNELEACRLWVEKDFSNISGALVERAYKNNPDDLELLAGGTYTCRYCGAEADGEPSDETPCEYCENAEGYDSGPTLAWPAGWGTLFSPNSSLDEDWIREHPQEVAKCGFLVYDCDEVGILLGVDGAGYNFYEAHWLPLYRARGLKWHDEKGGEATIGN